MKKLITTLATLILLTSASYSFDRPTLSIGGTSTAAYFEAAAHEVENSEKSQKEEGAALGGYVSVFGELTFADRLTIGIAYVPEDLETETVTTGRADKTTTATASTVTQTVKAQLEDMTTAYIAINLTDNFYVKFGTVNMDLITKETLGTGSAYGNTDLDGDVLGAGYNMTLDNGVFLRAEAMRVNIGGVSLTSTTNSANKIVLDDVDGVNASISIGKSF